MVKEHLEYYNINLTELEKISSKGSQLPVLFTMIKTMDQNNQSNITVEEICQKTELTRKTVSSMINYLTKIKVLEVYANKNDLRKNCYKIKVSLVQQNKAM